MQHFSGCVSSKTCKWNNISLFLACQGLHDDSMLGSVDVFIETSTLSDVSGHRPARSC